MSEPSIANPSEAAATYRLPWVPSDQRLVLAHLGSMRRSAVRTDAYEIECAFWELDEAFGFPLRGWAPFEQLGMLRPGSIFENRVLSGRDGRLVARQATKLQPVEMCQLNADTSRRHTASRRRPIGEPRLQSEIESMLPWACVAQAQGKRYYLPAGEILRFYFGALSLSAAAFMSLAANDEAAGLFDPEHTRFLEPDVLQIAPVSGLADRASALHLALLLHSPDLMKLWRSTVALFIAAGARGEPDFYPEIELPNTQHAFALLGRSEVIANSFEQGGERAFLVSSIASDYRTIPFKRLVIKLPSGLDEFELADLDEERLDASSRYQNILAPGLPLENRRRPGVRVTQMSPFHESLRIVLWHFYVDPTSRREGVGRRLIEVVKAHAVDCGARHIWLETSSLNVPGVNAYGALGFSLTGADLTLYDGTPSEGEIALFYSRGVRAQPPL